MLEIEAMTKITALDNGALKLLSEHCISCHLDQHGGACDYPYCKGATRLILKNAMSGGEKNPSLIHIVKRSEKERRRGSADSLSRRRDDDTTTRTRKSDGGGSSSSFFCSSWKSRSMVRPILYRKMKRDITLSLPQDEEGQMPTR